MEEPVNISSTVLEPPLPPQPIARSESDLQPTAKTPFSQEEWIERPAPLSNHLHKSPAPDQTPRLSWESNASECAFNSRSARRRVPERSGLGIQANSPTRESPPLDSPSMNPADEQGLLDAAWASEALDRRYAPPLPPPPPRHEIRLMPDRPQPGESGLRNRTFPLCRVSPALEDQTDLVQSANAATPKALNASNENTPLFETGQSTRASTHDVKFSSLPRNNRVMTPAEFEQYKKNVADSGDGAESQKSEDSDVYEDEDEMERSRQIAKQRRKQEAHLAVYRQQMMKVTGEQPSDLRTALVDRPTMSRSTLSLPNLAPVSLLDPRNVDADVGGKVSDDSDEDIPLGVLQAHGFPSKSRPPTRLANASKTSMPRPGSQMSSYPNQPNTDLPIFARNLPKDPYVGASLVNVSNRETLRYNSSAPAPSNPLPPGGLVGVIAGEERARALRRGSPNTNGVYGPVQAQQIGLQPYMGMSQPGSAMPSMPVGQPITSSEQAQMQMANQMAQMMQMQMQWMHQMIQMQNSGMQMPNFNPTIPLQSEGGSPYPSNFLGPLPFNQQPRPDSMLSAASTSDQYQNQHASSGIYQSNGKTALSSVGGYNQSCRPANGSATGPGYAPSIAPSERSNVGQPSRYRPVTACDGSDSNKLCTDTMSYTTVQNVGAGLSGSRQRSRSPHKLDLPSGASQGLGAVVPHMVKAVNKPKKGSGSGVGSDEEDDAAWAEVKKRREERKNRWNQRKKEKEQSELPREGLEGLYYDG